MSLELRAARLSHASHKLEFTLHGAHGPASLQTQITICASAQRSIEALRKVSPAHLEAEFDRASHALRTLRTALENSGQATGD